MRGRTLNSTFLIIDDAQNFPGRSKPYMKTLLTRVAGAAKVVLTGDLEQIDAPGLNEDDNGIVHVIRRMIGWEHFGCVKLTKGLRSPLATAAAERL